MKLSSSDYEAIYLAFLDAFDYADLVIMMRAKLGIRLGTISSERGTRIVVNDILDWAERSDRVDDLVAGAKAWKPTNSQLDALPDSFRHTIAKTPSRIEVAQPLPVVVAQPTPNLPGWFEPDIPHRRISDTRIITEKDGAEMMFVPEGEFIYGEDDTQRRIHLHAFWINKTPVTNAEYKRFIDANPDYEVPFVDQNWADMIYNWDKRRRTYLEGRADHPVTLLSHDDATAYAKWVGKQLPTEQEWEKAARGTDGCIYPWGNEWQENRCNTKEAGIGGKSPVGQFSPQGDSPFGCVDMSGNVWEWTNTKVKGSYGYILRGGSWLSSLKRATAVSSFLHVPGNPRNGTSGFRVCVRRPPPE